MAKKSKRVRVTAAEPRPAKKNVLKTLGVSVID